MDDARLRVIFEKVNFLQVLENMIELIHNEEITVTAIESYADVSVGLDSNGVFEVSGTDAKTMSIRYRENK